jgi:lysine 6-dehydrogenase
MKIIVLGAGLVGGPMAADLAKEPRFEVSVADRDPKALAHLGRDHTIKTIVKDLSDSEQVKSLVKDYDFVLSAVPGSMGYQTLRAAIEAEKTVVDIAFFPEDALSLDELAKGKGVTAIVDCGVAPGMSNILTGYVDHLLDETKSVLIYVGGLPEVREWPYEYKAVFSPSDVIEEYVRPARIVENGRVVVRPALSDPELLSFPGVGTLEAFNTDGLRTLAQTIKAPFMKEKTMRYPGHIEKMLMLRETGFFSQDEIQVDGVKVRPLDVTSKLLFPKWKLDEGERDITIMRVVIEGLKGGESWRYSYDLLDRYDDATRTHSMARTTGYTAAVVVRMLARGMFGRKGIIVPEFIGPRRDCVDFILKGLKERGVVYHETVEKL